MSRESIKAISEAYIKSIIKEEIEVPPNTLTRVDYDDEYYAVSTGRNYNATAAFYDYFDKNSDEFEQAGGGGSGVIKKVLPVDPNSYEIPDEVQDDIDDLMGQGFSDLDYPRNSIRDSRGKKTSLSKNLSPAAKRIYRRDPGRKVQKTTLWVVTPSTGNMFEVEKHSPELITGRRGHAKLKCSDMLQSKNCEYVIPGYKGVIHFMFADSDDKNYEKPYLIYIFKPYYTSRGDIQYGIYQIKGRRNSEADSIVKDYIRHTNRLRATKEMVEVHKNPYYGADPRDNPMAAVMLDPWNIFKINNPSEKLVLALREKSWRGLEVLQEMINDGYVPSDQVLDGFFSAGFFSPAILIDTLTDNGITIESDKVIDTITQYFRWQSGLGKEWIAQALENNGANVPDEMEQYL